MDILIGGTSDIIGRSNKKIKVVFDCLSIYGFGLTTYVTGIPVSIIRFRGDVYSFGKDKFTKKNCCSEQRPRGTAACSEIQPGSFWGR